MKECSVIIPFCNEYPQILFTIQSVIEELTGFCKFEVIVIDNTSDDKSRWCFLDDRQETMDALKKKGKKGPRRLNTWFVRKGVLKYIRYDDKLSHWNAKNAGVEASSGKYLFFLDAHCIMKRDSLKKMIEWMRQNKELIGGLHAYICYILDSHRLEYKPQKKTFGYQFCSAQPNKAEPYKVCVMSTCGMMCPRTVIDELGAWHSELGIYGGGESYINWKQSTCGYPHLIHPEAVCWHYADKRGYSWNYTDYMRNSFIAAYCVGGDKFLGEQVALRKAKKGARKKVIDEVAIDVKAKCREDREFIAKRQTVTFDEYIAWWEDNPGTWK